MVNFLKKNLFYKLGLFLVSVSCLMLISNQIIVVNKRISEDRKIDIIVNNEKVDNYDNDYVAVLEIPKINLKKGLVDIDSKDNNVEENIQIISSDISSIDSGKIILAAHSGSGYKAFFKDLDKLVLGDEASIYYNGKIYNYFVTNIYTEIKDGDIEIPDFNKTLILTTCYDKDYQLVVVLEQKGL